MAGEAHGLERGVEDGRHGVGGPAHREQGAARRRGTHRQALGTQGGADLLHLGRARARRRRRTGPRSGSGGSSGEPGVETAATSSASPVGSWPAKPTSRWRTWQPGTAPRRDTSGRDIGQLATERHAGTRRARGGGRPAAANGAPSATTGTAPGPATAQCRASTSGTGAEPRDDRLLQGPVRLSSFGAVGEGS